MLAAAGGAIGKWIENIGRVMISWLIMRQYLTLWK
jgi:hypothetical protein